MLKNSLPGQSLLRRFLAFDRFSELSQALRDQPEAKEVLSISAIVAALLVAAAPVLLTCLDAVSPHPSLPLPTIAFGISTLLAVVMRFQLDLRYLKVLNWKESLRLTHTAFALGCIPAVAMVVIFPESITQKTSILSGLVPSTSESEPVSLLQGFLFLMLLAGWAAVTEEFIFRGLMVSALRRWHIFSKQLHRDIFAGGSSALLFGLAHFATWGGPAAVALTGLGVGFVIAYLANGERLSPIILYHFLFDLLSLSVAIYLF